MPAVTIRKLSADTHRALKLRAARHGRSTEAEIRVILDHAVRPATAASLAQELAAFGREFNVTTEFDNLRDPAPAGSTVTFE